MADEAPTSGSSPVLDVVVVGAGFAGLYAVHLFRQRGLAVRAFEAGSGVGGTWFWNRYPGARCDVPSLEYSYTFSAELQQEWEWTEYFPDQVELERYLNHVADRFDLRRDIQLDTRVTAATFDEGTGAWTVETDAGDRVTTRFLVMATGSLSMPTLPEIEELDVFEGRVLQTSRWPDEVDLTGARIALIGTGSSGVQATPELAAVAEHLYVLQRTPTFTWPSNNAPMDPEVQRRVKENYPELRAKQRATPGGTAGFGGVPILEVAQPDRFILEATDEELADALAEYGFSACRVWGDIATDLEANERAVELYREMIRRTVADPEAAEALSPRGYPIGCKRPVMDTGYYEAFNRDNVTIVDLRRGGIERALPHGLRTGQGDLEVDTLVLATGFDAMTGALNRIDIRGRDGRLLRDDWAHGPRTLLGLQVEGYPNLFTVMGPGSPSVLSNMVLGAEQHVEWIADCIGDLDAEGLHAIEPTVEAQDDWVDQVNRVAEGTMFTAASCNSWYLGANVPGKPRVFLPYVGGFHNYTQKCEAVAESGYPGFDRH